MVQISKETWQNAMTYAAYRQKIDQLRAEGKTTGENHSEAMLAYTDLNLSRMNRLDKRTRLTKESLTFLEKITSPVLILTITEAWCGDAAQIVPVIETIAAQNSNIQQRLILRDENLDIMDQFLTNGGRSIPKFLFLDANSLEVLGDWGPRPAEVQAIMMDSKQKMLGADEAEKQAINEAVKLALHTWYAKDKTQKIQAEFLEKLALFVGLEVSA